MPRPGVTRRTVAPIALAALLVGASGAVAYGVATELIAVDEPASSDAVATRVDTGIGDLAVAYDVDDVDQFVIDASIDAARRSGGSAASSRGGSVGMRRITRNGAVVHAPPDGYLIPMVFSAVPPLALRGVYGMDVGAVLRDDTVVLNQMTADTTGAATGDVIDLRSTSGGTVSLTVVGVRPYAQVGGSELIFTSGTAAHLGFTGDTSMVMWGFDRATMDRALRDVGLEGRKDTKVGRSWDPPDPDDTISTARTKVALGEPWYRVEADGSITMHPTWIANNLSVGRVLLDPDIRVRAQCHVKVIPDLSAALAEVASAGLGSQIEVANANADGGCFSARYSRISGYLSRHAYGMAFDTNTTSNCQGCRPQMNCDVVRIFRRHGFAWGGNFRRPDGMHFEWVGGRRDQIDYPSDYCPNVIKALTQSMPTFEMGRDVLLLAPGSAASAHATD